METMARRIRTKKRFMGILAVGGAGRGPPWPRGPCKELTIYDVRLTIGHTHTKTQKTHFQGER